jgi:hypothetical protein
MKKNKINLILDSTFRNYPSLRLVKDHLLSRNSKDKAEQNNYKVVRDCDNLRVWLYVDLAKKYYPKLDISQTERWWQHYLEVDFYNYNKALNVVYESVRRSAFRTESISQLKTAVRRECNCSLNTLLGPIRVQVERLYLSKGSVFAQPNEAVDVIRDIVQWTRLSQKPVLDDPSLEVEAYEKFWATQDRLTSLWTTDDPVRQDYLSRLHEIVNRHFVDDREFILQRGKHGSGAVSDPDVHRDISMKTDAVAFSDPRLNYLALHNPGVKPTECGISFYTNEYGTFPTSDTAATFSTVPKNLEKRRGIALQKASRMWWQQATLDTFYRTVWCKPYVQKHLPIFDRNVNREMARIASVRNHLATIDLSAASDSVASNLVKAIFGPNVRRALLCARADHFHLDCRRFVTYATMGDASTFPVETIVFGACCKLALDLAVEYYVSRNTRPPFNTDEYYVFGDDILIPNDSVVLMFFHDICSRLGFVINDDKSFYYGPYRESCGIEAYLGESIEPFYGRLKLRKAERFGSLVGAANECYVRGLKCLRQYIIWLLANLCKGYRNIPWTERSEDGSSVFTPYLDVSRLVIRQVEDPGWARTFGSGSQVWEIMAVRSRSRKPDKDRLPGAEWYGLYTALSSRSERVSDTPIDYRATTHYISRSGKNRDSVLLCTAL